LQDSIAVPGAKRKENEKQGGMLLSPWNGIKYLSIGFHGRDGTINVSFTTPTVNFEPHLQRKSYYTVQ